MLHVVVIAFVLRTFSNAGYLCNNRVGRGNWTRNMT